MPGIDELFDRSGTVRQPPYPWLGAELWSLMLHYPPPPDPATLPRGDGHVVLVVPAFISGDGTTKPLRDFLTRCGYRVFGWELGVNLGPTPRVHEGLHRRLQACYELEGGPISVVGVSLGGLLARDLAYDLPHAICHVITLVSPFRLPTASTVAPVIQFCARYYSPAVDPRRLARPLPVPATAIFTQGDGVVAWETCRSDDPGCVSLEVGGPHATICRNPLALRHVAERLAAVRGLVAG